MNRLDDYGFKEDKELVGVILLVCSIFGNGSNDNANVIIEKTCRVESHFGNYPDSNSTYGEGVTQFDPIAFEDTIARTRESDKDKCKKYFGIDLDSVKYEDIRHNLVLQIVLTRLKYKLIPDEFPTDNIKQFEYYKKWWNSAEGAGDYPHWLELTSRCYFK